MYIVFNSHSVGMATGYNSDRTGAPGAGLCGNCHSGGSYGPVTTTIQVFSTGTTNPITSYVPGTLYDVRVTVNKSAGNPAGYGYELTCLTTPGDTPLSGYSNLASNVKQKTITTGQYAGRTYTEHNNVTNNNIFNFSWTAPVPGTGSVKFYACGLAANGSGNSSGDNSGNTTLTLSEDQSALSVTGTVTNVSCFGGSNGAINITPNGSAPFSFNWTGGVSTEDRTNLTAGTYSVTVTDIDGATATASFTVTQPASAVAVNGTTTAVACFGGSNGSINITASGGTSPYTYNWGGGITTEDRSNLSAGIYSVTVTDNNGCTTANSFNVTQPAAALSVTGTTSNITCIGGNNGSINITAAGGTSPYAYNWGSGITIEDRSNLGAGTYTVTVTDNHNCTTTSSFTITQPASGVVVTGTTADVTCFGGSNGSINITAAGGTSPYSYSWGGGITTEDRSNLAVGNYSVTTTDMNGCTTTASFAITQPGAITATTSPANISCFGGSNGAINLTVNGGTVPYTYDWSNDGPETPDNDTEDLSNLATGCFTVTITDINACTATASACITQPSSAVAVSGTAQNISCFGGNNGAINITASGGTAAYSYNWGGGISSEDRNNLTQGTYSVTVTDAQSCTTASSFTITQPASAVAVTGTTTSVTCSGGNNGSINITPSGGTSPYNYNWGGGITTEDRNNLSTGTYSVTVSDALNCTATAAFTIALQGTALVVTGSTTNISCFGGSNGTINITASGGSAPYSYDWGGGIATEDRTNLSAGTYTITASDNNGCATTASFSVTQPASAVAVTGATANVSCFGGNNGAINITASGGTSPYTYNWTGSLALEDRTNLPSGNYTVTVMDNNSCSTTASYTITQPASAVGAMGTVTNINCTGASSGAINMTANGGTSPYTYSWSDGITTKDRTAIAAGNYTVTVSDANSCTTTAAFTITEPAAALTIAGTTTNVSCNSGNNGAVNITASGGSSPYTYNWGGGITAEDRTNLAIGNYTVTVTDNNGCTATRLYTITQPAALNITHNEGTISCFNGSTTITIGANGGTAPYSGTGNFTVSAGTYVYTVTDANGCTASTSIVITQPAQLSATGSNITIACTGSNGTITVTASGGTPPYLGTGNFTVTSPGTYNYTVTDANGCTAIATGIANATSGLAASGVVDGISCNGNCDGSINVSVVGGTPPYTYLWNDGSASQDGASLCAGNYQQTVTDNAGCTIVSNFIIADIPALQVSATKDSIYCFGESSNVVLNVTGGTPPYNYLWNNGLTVGTAVVPAGTYSVTVSDANSCSKTVAFILAQPAAALNATGSVTNTSVFSASDGAINVAVSGGTMPYSYLWNDGMTTEDRNNIAAGIYTVTITDNSNCTTTAQFTVTQPSAEIIASGITTHVLCFGNNSGSINQHISGGVPPYSFHWENGFTTEDRNNLPAGNYSVTITDNIGTTTSAAYSITQPAAAMDATGSAINVSCFGGNNGLVDITVSGGVPPYDYNWGNGITFEDRTNLIAGSYAVTVTDENNCTTSVAFSISQPAAALTATDAITEVSVYGGNDGAIDITANGGTVPYSYSWNIGVSTEDLNNILAGNYSVTITDNNGCTKSEAYTVTQPNAPLNISGFSTNVACFGGNNGSIDITALGGVLPYSYNWGSGITSEDQNNLAAGSYAVTVTDGDLVTSEASFTITQPDMALNLSGTTINVACFGGNNGEIDLTAVGGTAPYSYHWGDGLTTEDRSNLVAGNNYGVTVTDVNSCIANICFTITEPTSAVSVAATTTDAQCFGGSDGQINAIVSGGTMPYTYAWSNGPDTEDLSGLEAGSYSVTVMDQSNCSATAAYIVSQPASDLAVSGSAHNVLCILESNGSIDLTVEGGTLPYTFDWSNGVFTEDISNLGADNYNVTVTDANSCSASASFGISEPDALVISLIDLSDNTGNSNGAIDISVAGGTAPYMYDWSNNADTEDISQLPDGVYTIDITDANGCTASAGYTILLTNTGELNAETIRIYPNPANDNVNINISGEPDSEFEIQVYSTNGVAIKKETLFKGNNWLNMSDLPAALYIFEIKSTTKQYRYLVMKL